MELQEGRDLALPEHVQDGDVTDIAATVAALSTSHRSFLLQLPFELIDAILTLVSPFDLVALSGACHTLRKLALSDTHWYPHVQENTPGVTLTSPAPCSTFHELFAAFDRLWFLPKHKIWFCDRDLMGKLIVARYDVRRGCIEGYQLLAEKRVTENIMWEVNHMMIHDFRPRVRLHLDKPVLQFRPRKTEAERQFEAREGANRYADEMPMELDERLEALFTNFVFGKALDLDLVDARMSSNYPYGFLWPPKPIPARHRVRGVTNLLELPELEPEDRPHRRSEVSDQTFRIRQWMEMTGSPGGPTLLGGRPWDITAAAVMPMPMPMPMQTTGIRLLGAMAGATGVHVGEEVITYSTLDPVLYTPTRLKPWRGVWVGDYSGHGCEFVLIHQPDDPPATDKELGLRREDAETDEQWEKRRTDARVYRGRLEGIKLTGDPNVPRGEYSFFADDLGSKGFVTDAVDPPFTGARVVKSVGHVADTGYREDSFIDSQLILINHNRLAQYWMGLRHVSYFERVDVDSFLVT